MRLKNFQHCLQHKPPLALFTLGLLTLAFAFLIISEFVRGNDSVRDYNFRTNWDEFLTGLTAISWSSDSECVKKADNLPEPSLNVSHHEIYVSVFLDNSDFEIQEGVTYQSSVWKEKLLPKELLKKKTNSVTVSFNCVTNNDSTCQTVKTGEYAGQMALCLNISSNEEFLSPQLRLPYSCSPSSGEIVKIYPCDKTPSSGFRTSYTPFSQGLEKYLDYAGRKKVCRRLRATSIVIFTIVAIITVYAFLKHRNPATPEETSNLNLLPVEPSEQE